MADLECFDTNVLVATMRPEDARKFAVSTSMIQNVEDCKTILILPMWAMLELIDAMKRLIARKSKPKEITPSQVEAKIRSTVRKIAGFVIKMIRKGHIIMPKDDEAVSEYYENIYNKLEKYPIKVVKSQRQYRLRSMGFRDISHLYHAQRNKAVRFYTWDKGFENAMDDPDFGMVEIKILA